MDNHCAVKEDSPFSHREHQGEDPPMKSSTEYRHIVLACLVSFKKDVVHMNRVLLFKFWQVLGIFLMKVFPDGTYISSYLIITNILKYNLKSVDTWMMAPCYTFSLYSFLSIYSTAFRYAKGPECIILLRFLFFASLSSFIFTKAFTYKLWGQRPSKLLRTASTVNISSLCLRIWWSFL
jgi:hypothetical protein